MKAINLNLDKVTIEDIENHKIISDKELKNDIKRLLEWNPIDNRLSFLGNPFLYHHQLRNLLQCKREKGQTIYDVWNDKDQWEKLLESTRKRDRGGRTVAGNVYEAFRANTGSIVMFKSTTAKYLYSKYGAQSVLDPTAGWGGRMLGAWALDINYTGVDTNKSMIPAYNSMIDYLESYSILSKCKLDMIWNNALDVDFSEIEYDFVLTSPPYINMELYEYMTPYDSNEMFYKEFFIPLFHKCVEHIDIGGKVCFNISPKMYEEALTFGLDTCDLEEDLLQQLGQQKGKKKQDKVYIWKC